MSILVWKRECAAGAFALRPNEGKKKRNVQGFFLPFAVLVILLVLAIIVGIWLLSNSWDESLRPEVRAALEARHDSVAPQDNLFYAIAALDSQSNVDLNQQGRELYQKYLEARKTEADASFVPGEKSSAATIQFVGDRQKLCGDKNQREDCFERAVSDPEELRKLISDNRILLDRYKSLRRYEHLQNPLQLTIASSTLSWAPFTVGKRLFLTEVALEIAAGQVDAGITQLRDDFAFTRRMLAEPDIYLIDKLILVANTRSGLRFVSDLVRSGRLSDAQYAELLSLVAPLSDQERSFAGVFTREFTMLVPIIRELTDPKNAAHLTSSENSSSAKAAGYLASHMIKYNASLNFAWSFVADNQRASAAGCTKYLENKARLDARIPLKLADYFYNPIGKILVKTGAGGSTPYIQSMCVLDGMNRIVGLQLMMRIRHIRDEDMIEFVNRADIRYANPFTNKPMKINLAERTLTFDPIPDRDKVYLPWPI